MNPPMPWWRRWPNRAHLAFTSLKYRIARLLHRAGLLPSKSKAATDTMGDWKRLQAMADDPKPRLMRPPDGPYADLIRRVRLYAQNGAKALAPLLDRQLGYGEPEETPHEWIVNTLAEIEHRSDSPEVYAICAQLRSLTPVGVDAVTRAYNAPWTVKDGEVWEVVTEKAREEVVL